MSSQRAREAVIVSKLRSGALAPAPPGDAHAGSSQGTPPAPLPCRGCDEPEGDILVAAAPWHQLCYLYWQGRSDTLRASGMSGAARWVVVAHRDRPDVAATLERTFARSPWVAVVVDRRRGERRQQPPPSAAVDRRLAGRRSSDSPPGAVQVYRLGHRGVGFEVYEAVGPQPVRCLTCSALVSVDMPRFVEPPARLQLRVLHETQPPNRPWHAVELESLSPTGRVLLASRVRARTLQAA
jgi:hypothetical protein